MAKKTETRKLENSMELVDRRVLIVDKIRIPLSGDPSVQRNSSLSFLLKTFIAFIAKKTETRKLEHSMEISTGECYRR